jgi:hypothetical protein
VTVHSIDRITVTVIQSTGALTWCNHVFTASEVWVRGRARVSDAGCRCALPQDSSIDELPAELLF